MGFVVVTGASTGIGRATAVHLAERGLDVIATVRRPEDADALRALGLPRLEVLFLDVTDAASVARLAEQVDARVGAAGLAGLVNNAGVALARPMELVDLGDLRWQLEVNVVGVVAVTQALLPALRRGTGRVVNVGSLGGRVTSPFMGPYTLSKHALVAVTAALRHELAPWGLHASIIEPGAIATAIWDKGREEVARVRASPEPAMEALYPGVLDGMAAYVERQAAAGIPPERVARAVHHALTARRPRTRYPVGVDAWVATTLARLLPEAWMDRVVRAAARFGRAGGGGR